MKEYYSERYYELKKNFPDIFNELKKQGYEI
jgi:hypothetical protein